MAGNGDMQAHEATYGKIMGLMKWGAVACFAVAVAVVLIIAR